MLIRTPLNFPSTTVHGFVIVSCISILVSERNRFPNIGTAAIKKYERNEAMKIKLFRISANYEQATLWTGRYEILK
jgi:hypothetical protein